MTSETVVLRSGGVTIGTTIASGRTVQIGLDFGLGDNPSGFYRFYGFSEAPAIDIEDALITTFKPSTVNGDEFFGVDTAGLSVTDIEKAPPGG
jgi:hypothetical protein